MTVPLAAVLEAVRDFPSAPGIVIFDVSALLDAEAQRVRRGHAKPYGKRAVEGIDSIIVHKTGGNGPKGYRGASGSTRYVVAERGWWGAAYTYWVSREADRDAEGRIVVYRCQPDGVRSWHTGGRMNRVGIGIGVQGNYDGQWDLLSNGLPRIERAPTADQMQALPLLIDYLVERHGINIGRDGHDDDWGLSGHWEHGKPVCPGDSLRRWVMVRRGEIRSYHPEPPTFSPELPPPPATGPDPFRFAPMEYQQALADLGFDPGPIDGMLGPRTRAALEAFQRHVGATPDGWYGPQTAAAMAKALASASHA